MFVCGVGGGDGRKLQWSLERGQVAGGHWQRHDEWSQDALKVIT